MRLAVALAVVLAALARADAAVRIERVTWAGWRDAYRVSNGTVDLVVVPQVGRVMRYGFVGGPNVLWVNAGLRGKTTTPATSKEWANFGGDKLWPAPQARWSWPPDPYLDGAPCRVDTKGSTLRLVGPVSPTTRLRFVREFRLSPRGATLTVRNTLRNEGAAPVEWSVWEVAQVDDPDVTMLPIATRRFPGGCYAFKDNAPARNLLRLDGRVVRLKRNPAKSAKIGTDSRAGWAACRKGNVTFWVSAATVAGARYPDEGCNAEVFTSPDPARYCELELLGPITRIPPRGAATLVTRWELTRGARR